jgi:hypothetical protein
MNTHERLFTARVGMRAMADELQSMSRACQIYGISCSNFHEIKTAFDKYGRDGLAPAVRRRPSDAERDPDGAGTADSLDDAKFPGLLLRSH